MFNVKKFRRQFKTLTDGSQLAYLDNASTTQTPKFVANAIKSSYIYERANVHRGLYKLSQEVTEHYEHVREQVAEFINADKSEIIFNSGATHGLNHLAYSLCQNLKRSDNVVLTEMEHHANIVPWQVMSKRYGFELRFIPVENSYHLSSIIYNSLIDKNTQVVSFTAVSNVLGTINPIREIVDAAHKVDAIAIVDAAQAVAHMKVDVKAWDCDFLVFSAHKMYGPTGVGVLYGKKDRLEALEPFIYGGHMISEVTRDNATWAELPHRLEGGTQNIVGVFGLGATLQFLLTRYEQNFLEEVWKHESELTNYLITQLSLIDGLKIIGPQTNTDRIGVVSFNVGDTHPHDVAEILARYNIAVRAGHHCCMPLMQKLGIPGMVRASLAMYNTNEDVDRLIEGVKKAKEVLYGR